MSMPYPDHDLYAKLYAKYLTGNRTERMLDLAGPLANKNVVDLCAGGGRLTEMALSRGATVAAVDESNHMLATRPNVRSFFNSISAWLNTPVTETYDAAFCQQAINYWLHPDLVPLLRDRLTPSGVFIFNTFNVKPSTKPAVKEYTLDNVAYVELSWMSGDHYVEHVQIREGFPPHTTRFRWISPDDYAQWLAPCFELTPHMDGPTTVWVCKKR